MKAHISFFVEVPDDVSKQDARDALLFHLNWKHEIKNKNPMVNWNLEPEDEPLVDFEDY